MDDPWQGIEAKFPVGARFKGRVTNITDYGAFVELEPGIEGLIHVSEMSWTKKNVHPGKIVSTSQEVEVQILEVDPVKRRISLGLKQTMRNPWEVFVEKYPPGTTVEGEVKNKTEFGLFLGLDGDVDGMVHLSDLDWKRPGEQVIEEYKKGDKVQAQVLDVDVEKERISLGIKQLQGDPMASAGEIKKGDVVTTEVTEVKESGIDVKIVGTELTSFIKRSELARDRNDQRSDRFQVGQKVDARVVTVRPPRPQGAALDQGARSGRGEGGDRPVRLLRFRRHLGRHSRHRARSEGRGGRRRQGVGAGGCCAKSEPPGRNPGVHFFAAIRRHSGAARRAEPGIHNPYVFRNLQDRGYGFRLSLRSAGMTVGESRRTCYNAFRIKFEGTEPCRSMPISSSIAAGCGAS